MKNLIRPMQFTVARTGLFLAVVAWVVGQWWFLSIGGPVVTSQLSPTGIKTNFLTRLQAHVRINAYESDKEPPSWFDPTTVLGFNKSAGCTATLLPPGVVLFKSAGTTFAVGGCIRHWLIVSFFALFYGVLNWVYWKRGKKEPADE